MPALRAQCLRRTVCAVGSGARAIRSSTLSIVVFLFDQAFTGGLERWLYRLVRKHGGRQSGGWSFDFVHLHAKSGSLSPLKHFAYDLRDIVRRQALPGYRLVIERAYGLDRLSFSPHLTDPFERAMPRRLRLVEPGGGQ